MYIGIYIYIYIQIVENRYKKITCGVPRGVLGSATGPPGAASCAAPGTLRAPGRGAQRGSEKSARTSK
eukprot:3481609-Pyramimonas_sp.AAC.1